MQALSFMPLPSWKFCLALSRNWAFSRLPCSVSWLRPRPAPGKRWGWDELSEKCLLIIGHVM